MHRHFCTINSPTQHRLMCISVMFCGLQYTILLPRQCRRTGIVSMSMRFVTIDIHISCCCRQPHHCPLHVGGDHHLAAQARRLREPPREVEHVLLVLRRLLQHVINLVREHDVAGGACEGALARSLEVDVFSMGEFQQINTNRCITLVRLPGFVHLELYEQWERLCNRHARGAAVLGCGSRRCGFAAHDKQGVSLRSIGCSS